MNCIEFFQFKKNGFKVSSFKVSIADAVLNLQQSEFGMQKLFMHENEGVPQSISTFSSVILFPYRILKKPGCLYTDCTLTVHLLYNNGTVRVE